MLSIYVLGGLKLLPAFQAIFTYLTSMKSNISAYDNIRQNLIDCKEEEINESILKKDTEILIEMDLKTFDPKIMDMLRKETELRNEYTQLVGGAQIEFDGKTYNLAGLGPFHTDQDRDLRKRSYHARFQWFEENADQFDRNQLIRFVENSLCPIADQNNITSSNNISHRRSSLIPDLKPGFDASSILKDLRKYEIESNTSITKENKMKNKINEELHSFDSLLTLL